MNNDYKKIPAYIERLVAANPPSRCGVHKLPVVAAPVAPESAASESAAPVAPLVVLAPAPTATLPPPSPTTIGTPLASVPSAGAGSKTRVRTGSTPVTVSVANLVRGNAFALLKPRTRLQIEYQLVSIIFVWASVLEYFVSSFTRERSGVLFAL